MSRPPLNQMPSEVPAKALRFAAEIAFGTLAPSADPLAPMPITVKARSNQPVEHWFWGRIVHDMAGMFTTKPKIPFDYTHGEPIGVCDRQEATDEGLICSGKLLPFIAGDRASEVKFRGAGGTPYEASINWTGDGILIEQVPEGTVAPVNGYQFEGPGVIVREWPLRGVSICLYGADAHTETVFKEGATVPVRYLSQDERLHLGGDRINRFAATVKLPIRRQASETPKHFGADNLGRIAAAARLPVRHQAQPNPKTDFSADAQSRFAASIRLPGRM